MLPFWQTAIVEQVLDASPNTRRYFLRLSQPFDFIPGQFVTVDLPIHEKKQKRWRSYSIASAPDGGNLIELIIVQADPGTGGSSYIWQHWQPGAEVVLRGPQGVFTLPQPAAGEALYLIGTGTGIAPFRSMLLHWVNAGNFPPGGVHLVFGCRTRHDLLYHEEMQALSARIPAFRYHPVLSREVWEGPTGYVHPLYEKLCSHRPPALFMLCGWQAMVDEATNRILALGYDKNQIRQELYG